MKRLLVVLFLLITFNYSYALDRCKDYVPEVRSSAIRYLGLSYPYWYNMGCMIAESNCRADIVSFDGGIGLFQFTPSTGVLAEIKSGFGTVNPRNPQSSIRAQAYYMNTILNKHLKRSEFLFKKKYAISPKEYSDHCGIRISDAYRYYNGGYWFIYESLLTDQDYSCDRFEMRKHCVRGGAWVGSGAKRRWLSFCDVNYSYPEKIEKFARPYKTGKDEMRYW